MRFPRLALFVLIISASLSAIAGHHRTELLLSITHSRDIRVTSTSSVGLTSNYYLPHMQEDGTHVTVFPMGPNPVAGVVVSPDRLIEDFAVPMQRYE